MELMKEFASLNDQPMDAPKPQGGAKGRAQPKKQQQDKEKKGWACFPGSSLGVVKSWPLGWKTSQAIRELLQNLFEVLPGCKLSGPTAWEG